MDRGETRKDEEWKERSSGWRGKRSGAAEFRIGSGCKSGETVGSAAGCLPWNRAQDERGEVFAPMKGPFRPRQKRRRLSGADRSAPMKGQIAASGLIRGAVLESARRGKTDRQPSETNPSKNGKGFFFHWNYFSRRSKRCVTFFFLFSVRKFTYRRVLFYLWSFVERSVSRWFLSHRFESLISILLYAEVAREIQRDKKWLARKGWNVSLTFHRVSSNFFLFFLYLLVVRKLIFLTLMVLTKCTV